LLAYWRSEISLWCFLIVVNYETRERERERERQRRVKGGGTWNIWRQQRDDDKT
jgi:hypothetical protein